MAVVKYYNNDRVPNNISATELGYLDGVTSAIQTQLNSKMPLAGGLFTGQVGFDVDSYFVNDKSLTFRDPTDTNNNSFKTGSDGTFIFDIGAGNSVNIKGGDSAGAERLAYTDASFNPVWRVDTLGRQTLAEGGNIILGTTTGTKIGTAASQKLGFYNATPIVQPTAGAATAGAAYGANEQTMLQTVYDNMRNLGLMS